MPEKTEIEAEVAAEKAYAAAAEAVTAKPAPDVDAVAAEAPVEAVAPVAVPEVAPVPVPEVEFPSKAKRTAKPKAAPAPAPVAKEEKPVPVAKAPKPVKAKPAALKAAVVARKAKPKAAVKPKIIPPKSLGAKAPAQPKIAAPKVSSGAAPKPTITKKTVFQQIKDKTMDTAEFTTKIKGAVTEAQTKAKEAFDKGAATFAEYNEFSKGNVEAVVASGKILATGLQSLGKTFVDDGKSAFETLTTEVKELAAVKSPVDFFKLQVEFLRRNFDIAVANTSKNSEAVLKLASEAAAPISGRVNLAVEKIKKAA